MSEMVEFLSLSLPSMDYLLLERKVVYNIYQLEFLITALFIQYWLKMIHNLEQQDDTVLVAKVYM